MPETLARNLMAVTTAVAFGACASHTGVLPVGPDTFLLAKQGATGSSSSLALKAEVITDGNAHCRTGGKEFLLVSLQESKPPYFLGNFPRAEITFMCLAKGDPDLKRPGSAPDRVIELRNR